MASKPVLLLDLDGTLVDVHDAIVDGVLEVAAELGLAPPSRALARDRIGHDPLVTWELLGAPEPRLALDTFSRRVLPRLPQAARVLPGVEAALAELAARGHRMALATTRLTESARATLEVTGLDAWVEHVSGRDLVRSPKPAPDVLLHALDALGARPDQALMVGDSDADVLAARAAGLPCWGVVFEPGSEQALRSAGAALILSGGVADLPAALETNPWPPAGS